MGLEGDGGDGIEGSSSSEGWGWQEYRNRRALAQDALETDGAAEKVDIPFDDMQSQAGAFDIEGIAAAEEAAEEM